MADQRVCRYCAAAGPAATALPKDPALWNAEKGVELVIDEAGKVRSARLSGGVMEAVSLHSDGDPETDWLENAAGWKYIPAFKDGHPRAFSDHLRVLRDR